mmetsp:Transcript_131229/g.356278  ORF Transcript_131229/g.356278 Transcript_131229/m.356278 type:complete len:335 (-) Transcript_131229:680-1684(-)
MARDDASHQCGMPKCRSNPKRMICATSVHRQIRIGRCQCGHQREYSTDILVALTAPLVKRSTKPKATTQAKINPAKRSDDGFATHTLSSRASLLQVCCEECRGSRQVWRNLGHHMKPGPRVLPVDELALLALLRGVQVGQGRYAGAQLAVEVDVRAAQQLHLPARHLLHRNAVSQVLAAEHCSRRSNHLRPVHQERRVCDGELDQVVGQAEALLGPARAAQEAAQERVDGGLVEAGAQRLAHLAQSLPDLLHRARAVGDEGEPGGELQVVLHVALAVPANGQQRAGHAHQLELGPLHGVPRDVGVHVPVGAEQHVLRVRQPVCRKGHLHPGVHL